MKVYVAKDWTGVHVFKDIPRLEKCGGLPEIWCGHRIRGIIEDTLPLVEYDIPRGQYIERDIFWSIVHIIK